MDMDFNQVELGVPYSIPSEFRFDFLEKIQEVTGMNYDYLVNYEGKTILFPPK